MPKKSRADIRRDLKERMKDLEYAVKNSWQYANRMEENLSGGIKDPKPADDLYQQLLAISECSGRLFSSIIEYRELQSREKPYSN